MAKEGMIEVEGTVQEVLPSTQFRVKLLNGGQRARIRRRQDAAAAHSQSSLAIAWETGLSNCRRG
jgi:hypothetical protein